jgi:hypothetical protein
VGCGACPELMRHIAEELHRQLGDPAGGINIQVPASAGCMHAACCQQVDAT